MANEEPFLQIVHVSDMHIVHPTFAPMGGMRAILRVARQVPEIYESVVDGIAPHDPLAPPLFEAFLKSITIQDATWDPASARARETWLVETGDLTTFGDDASLKEGQRLLQTWARGAGAKLFSQHGNHDAWPENFPALATPTEIANHQAKLRHQWYPSQWPAVPLRCPMPNGTSEVQLYGLNSVLHDRVLNTAAFGTIEHDCFWKLYNAPIPGVQMERLGKLIDQHTLSNQRNFRMVATHHPIHYPRPRPTLSMVMLNDRNVANTLNTPSPRGAMPRTHLALSGHTHRLFPAHDELPTHARLCDHPELGIDQCQLVVGSLMQFDTYNKRGLWPHQCQILRLYADPSSANIVIVERLVAARGGGVGSYQFVPRRDGSFAEEIAFTY